MKKLICILSALCLMLPACALALDLETYNTYADVFGAEELDAEKGVQKDKYLVFDADACRVVFTEDDKGINRIFVTGSGESFLRYAMAAVMVFNTDHSNFQMNAGALLTSWLLSRNDGESGAFTAGGQAIVVQYKDGKYSFTVGR